MSVVEQLLLNIAQRPIAAYAIAGVAVLVTVVLIVFLISAYRQGREIVIWKLTIGGRPATREPPGRAAPATPLEHEVPQPSAWPPSEEDLESVENGDLGEGITIGGLYRDLPLRLVATDWRRWRDTGRVKSGWLYCPAYSGIGHAVAFFKIHLGDDGNGYIHILDASHPSHTIWARTETDYRYEKRFGWNESSGVQRTDLWRFRWKLT